MGPVFDVNDVSPVSSFWAAALELEPTVNEENWPTLRGDPQIEFMPVPEPKTAKNRMHLDFTAGDREAQVARLVDLGATRLADHRESLDGEDYEWTVLADTAGNEFCVIRSLDDDPPDGLSFFFVVYDCEDPERASAFWAAALERKPATLTFRDTGDGTVREPEYNVLGEPNLFFTRVPEPRTAKSRLHLDWATTDLAKDVARAIGLGATHLWDQRNDWAEWTTLADTEGNEFCVVRTFE